MTDTYTYTYNQKRFLKSSQDLKNQIEFHAGGENFSEDSQNSSKDCFFETPKSFE